jgi:DNA-binding MarR family transcriptional regulator
VYLAQKGLDLKASFFKISEQLFEIEYKGLNEEEIRIFNDLLNKIHRNFLERRN